jgi:hypothetical protein
MKAAYFANLPPQPMTRILFSLFNLISLAVACIPLLAIGDEPSEKSETWKPLFNGKDLWGWHIIIGRGPSDDTNHLVQIHDGMIHMYKDAKEGSAQPVGYIATDEEYSDYHLKLEYKWGQKRFTPRARVRRDAGILYHVVGKEGVWPRSIECQIQEEDVGDIFTVYTRVEATVSPDTNSWTLNVITNDAGVIRSNLIAVFLPRERGGVPMARGNAGGIQRVIRSPMNEHEGWNTVEVIVYGNDATYVVNGKTNNHAGKIEEMVNKEWVPLKKGRIALQLEYAEVFYRNVQIRRLTP